MAVYEYCCRVCRHEFEHEQRITDPPLDECPKCLVSALYRSVSGTTFIVKGPGWAADGYSSTSSTPKKD